jgi:hypothetical protein
MRQEKTLSAPSVNFGSVISIMGLVSTEDNIEISLVLHSASPVLEYLVLGLTLRT